MWTVQERLRFIILAAMAALDVVLFAGGSMTMRWHDLLMPLTSASLLLMGAAYFRRQRRRPALCATLIAVAQMVYFAVLAAILNYLLLSDRPLIDPLLARLDVALGCNWQAIFATLKGGAFGQLLTFAYQTNGVQIAGLLLLLGLTMRTAELDRFLLAFFIATLGALGFWAVFPSLGAAPYLLSTGAIHDIPGATVGRAVAQAWLDLKAGLLKEMYLDELKGLVAFPSVHTVMALLIVHAVRNIRAVFWPALGWNALMLLSIPVDGGHHVVDMAGGAALTWLALAAARHIIPMAEHRAASARAAHAHAAQARLALHTR